MKGILGWLTMGSLIFSGCQSVDVVPPVDKSGLENGESLAVIPAVQFWGEKSGSVNLANFRVGTDDAFGELATLFSNQLTAAGGPSLDDGRKPGSDTIFFVQDAKYQGEAYAIVIDEGITVHAGSYDGAFYGAQTLIQLIVADNGQLAKGVIEDAPQYPVRSMLLDVGRKFVSVDGLKDWIRLMGRVKMNELHLHLNDNSWGKYYGYRLQSDRFPGLANEDGHYTFAEIRELQDFAKLHGVEIVPEIDSPGHSLAFTNYRPDLAMPEMNREGFGLAYLDLANPEALTFMKELLDEVVPLFDSPYFHIGTDEYRLNLIKDPQRRAEYGEMFRQYINTLNAYIREKHGKTVRIWSGYEHMPGTTEPDTSIVIDMWETTDAVVKSQAGYQFVNSTHFYTYIVPGMPYYGVSNPFIYNDWNPRIFNKNQPETGILPEDAAGLKGAKLHVWNDAGPTGYTWNEIARLTWPSMVAIAEKMWGVKGSANYGEFVKRAASMQQNSGVALLNRTVQPQENATVWSLDSDKYFIANTREALNVAGGDDLEWPWTAEFTLTRQSDTIGKDTLISSDLAAFYVDLEHTFLDKKSKKETVKRGVACVRANQAAGYEPLLAHRPDVLVFNYQVPMNEKVTLKFVGQERQTSLYVNGQLIETKPIQMVCPLQRLGAQNAESFQGILHQARIENR